MALIPRKAAAETDAVGPEHSASGLEEEARGKLRKRKGKRRQVELDTANRPERPNRKAKGRRKGEGGSLSEGQSGRAHSIGELHPEQDSGTFPVAIVGADARLADDLFLALADRFSPLQFGRASHASGADFVVSFGSIDEENTRKDKQLSVIVQVSDSPEEISPCARAAKVSGAILLGLEPFCRRYNAQRMLREDGLLSGAGCEIIADAIRQRVVGAQAGIALASGIAVTPDDLAAALALAESPADLLRGLDWPGKGAPKSWRMPIDPRAVQAFLSGKISVPTGRRQKLVSLPIDWKSELPEAEANTLLHSLEFLSGVLVYWLQKANRVSSETMSQVDKAVKKRNATASALLGSAGDLIVDFLPHESELPDSAWRLPVVQRRSCVFALYLLCCRTAVMRRIKVDETRCGPVFRGLLEALERIRSSAEWPLGTGAGLANAALLASLALPLRKLPYGSILLEESLKALRDRHLALGMSTDGFWWEGIAQQGEVLGTLRLLSDDLRQAGVATRPVENGMRKMAVFADALLQEDSTCPPINEWPPVRQAGTLRAARAVLKPSRSAKKSNDALPVPPAGKAVLFADAGFFISRGQTEGGAESELVVQMRPPSQGGTSLSFTCGKSPLLVGGGAATGRTTPQVRRATRLSPAAHNAVRINGRDYPRANSDPAASCFERVWDDSDWAATRLVSNIFAGAQIRRTVIHLKSQATLLIVDDIIAESAVTVEQFWHFAPELQPEQKDVPHCLSAEEGVLNAAFAPDAAVKLLRGGNDGIGWTNSSPREVVPNWYAVQQSEGDRVLMGACFQWGTTPMQNVLRLEAHPLGWNARAVADGVALHFQSRDGQLVASGQA